MPPFPKLSIAALDDLARQLRFAPAPTLRRQLDRAEALAGELDPAVMYPEDWIVFRITGYRPDTGEPAAFSGLALLADLSGLVERLSAAAGISESDLEPGRFMDAAGVCARWKISRKTLDRYRRLGLVARRVRGSNGKPRLVFPVAAVERFEAGEARRLEQASGFSRIEPALEARMLRRAAAYRRAGLTLNQAAQRIARRYGRGHETVRQLLRRHDRGRAGGSGPIFTDRGPPSARERRLIERASWRAIEPTLVARRLHRSPPAVHRVINDARASRLRALFGAATAPAGDTLSSKYLLAEPVTTGLGAPGDTDLLRLVRAARAGGAPLGVPERARAAAYHFLVARAHRAVLGLPAHGAAAAAVDQIETDLRWAMRLKAELIRSQLPLLVRTLESSIGRGLEEVRSSLLAPLVLEAIAAIGEAVDAFDPAKGGRLAAPAGMALTRIAVRFNRDHSSELRGPVSRPRAAARLGDGVAIEDWTRRVCPWQTLDGRCWLEPDARIRRGMERLDERGRLILAGRYGWGSAPATVAQLAERLGTTVMAAGRLERRAIREAIAAAG